MATSALPLDSAVQIRRFARFLSWALPIVGVCVVAGYLSFMSLRNPTWAVFSVALTCLWLAWGTAWLLVRQQRLRLAVRCVCWATLAISIFLTVFIREFMTVLVLAPIMVAAFAVTFAETSDDVSPLLVASAVVGVGNIGLDLVVPPILPTTSLSQINIVINTSTLIIFIIGALFVFRRSLIETFAELRQTNRSLFETRAQLQHEVDQRTAELQLALADMQARSASQEQLLADLEQQRLIIRELSVPVLPISSQMLIMPLVGALDSARINNLQQRALETLEQTRARRLLLDITGVPVVDTQVAKGLISVVNAAKLLGAQVTLVGIRPEVAQTLVQLGIDLRGIQTYSDLQSAIARRDGHQQA